MFRIAYSALSLISSSLVLSLLPWFVRYKNVPGLFTVGWLFIVNFLYGINAAVLDKETLLRVPAYCDIVTKLFLGLQIAVPMAMLCYVFSIYDWMVRPKERNLRIKYLEHRGTFHAALCFFTPLAYMVLRMLFT
ncbi:GPCR fungal pheromone mating factor [Phellopilus nigrolimitatus]|nr:GPCR fungal pheromone mating factor [Phellopilus nigrolimitatus]